MATSSSGAPAPRRRRSDGERTHEAILRVATDVASVEGINGLTIGRLAEALGVSKSGLYAHFGSKERLQLETIDAAKAVFEKEVLEAATQAPEGLPRLEALCEAYLSYVERHIFPGGCFFASLLAEMDARSGPVHDVVAALEQSWIDGLAGLAVEAQKRGELAADADAKQLAFELEAVLDLGNYHFALFRDHRVLDRSRTAVQNILGRAGPRSSKTPARAIPPRRPGRRPRSG